MMDKCIRIFVNLKLTTDETDYYKREGNEIFNTPATRCCHLGIKFSHLVQNILKVDFSRSFSRCNEIRVLLVYVQCNLSNYASNTTTDRIKCQHNHRVENEHNSK
jgi:hypothetical protein